MRKIISAGFVLLLSASLVAQQPDNNIATHYLEKASHQNTAAWLTLSTGFVVCIVATAVSFNHYWDNILDDRHHDATAENILAAAGIGAMGASIPLFIAAGRNKQKARLAGHIGITWNQAYQVQASSFQKINYPALSLRIDL